MFKRNKTNHVESDWFYGFKLGESFCKDSANLEDLMIKTGAIRTHLKRRVDSHYHTLSERLQASGQLRGLLDYLDNANKRFKQGVNVTRHAKLKPAE